jgi:phosphatidylethanolamine-binding protein (PEBP) family uncharacterized protein
VSGRAVATALAALLTGGCATTAPDTASLARMGVDVGFDARHKCQGVSPQIRLSRVPAGVAAYEVKMTDLDVPSFSHWSQTLPASGPVIPEGAGGARYHGPCPPIGTHRYQIEVIARDAQKKPIAYGDTVVVAGR